MKKLTVLHIAGYFPIGFGLTLIFPILVSLYYSDGEVFHFLLSMVVILAIGFFFVLIAGKEHRELTNRDGFLVVAIFWIGISHLAALPFMLTSELSFVDALFEAVSAFTTTGATVMSGLDHLPKSILIYRQQLQWLGGMGMIVLAVAVLPLMGIGGMQLYRAEVPGPMKEEKITPRLTQTARLLWGIYVAITIANAFAYWLAGMTPFDAIAHSLSTVSTGGFSTHDASLSWFKSSVIENVAIFFMLLGAISFSLHFSVWQHRNPLLYLRDTETRSYLLIVLVVILVVSVILRVTGVFTELPPSLRSATFEVVSVITSTGYGTVDFSHWPVFLPLLLILISFIGGCGGSTAGGMKVSRILVLFQLGLREIRLLIHPKAVLSVRLGNKVVSETALSSILGFFGVYIFTFVILVLLMMFTGMDQVSAFSSIATSMNNLGPGLGKVATTFIGVSDPGKLIAAFAMILGRLEIFTIIVLLTPAFWRK